MCYPCTSCGRCGKFDPNSPLYTPPPTIPCMKCGADIDPTTGCCTGCGDQAFTPTSGMMLAAKGGARDDSVKHVPEGYEDNDAEDQQDSAGDACQDASEDIESKEDEGGE